MNRLEKMQEFYKSLKLKHIDLPYYADEQHESLSDLEESLERNNALNVDVIYYSEAIKFLAEHDPSLRESLAIASDFGYEDLSALSSEVLASLLASEQARQEFYDASDMIEEFFETLNEDLDGEEED